MAPELTMPPWEGVTVQVTPVLDVPVKVAVSDWVCDGCNVAVAGVTEIPTGGARTTLALAEMAGLATLAAFTVIDCPAGIDEGAVYNPLAEIVPTAGVNDQVTAELAMPVTLALKVWV